MRRKTGHAWMVLLAGICAAACDKARAAPAPPLVAYTPVERVRSDSSAELMGGFAVDVDSRGNFYVADRWAIRVFAPDGRLVRSIGRQGEGPGEFSFLHSVEVMPGDSLFAYDTGLRRVSVFAPGANRVAYTIQVGRDETFSAWQVWRVPRDRSIAALFQAAYVGGHDEGFEQRKGVVRLFNPDGSLRQDSVLSVRQQDYLIMSQPHSVMITSHPFGSRPLLAMSPRGRIVRMSTDSLTFDLYSPEGRHLKTLLGQYPAGRRPVLGQERDSAIAEVGRGGVEAQVRRAMDEHDIRQWPLVQDMIVDDEERIWAAITGERGGPNHWVAFDMDGRAVARMDLPVRTFLRKVHGTTAYATTYDENDVPQVVVFDLKPSGTLALNSR